MECHKGFDHCSDGEKKKSTEMCLSRFSDSTYASEGCHPSTELSDIGLRVKSPANYVPFSFLRVGSRDLRVESKISFNNFPKAVWSEFPTNY